MVRPTEEPFVSLVILNYNGRRNLGGLLDDCLLSALNMDYLNFEVLFVDNGSIDNSVEYIRERFGQNKRLRTISLNKNYGYAKGNNSAVKYADSRSKYLGFLTTDIKIGPTWLREMVNLIEEESKRRSQRLVAAASSTIYDVSRRKLIDELWISYPSGAYDVPLKSESLLKKVIEIDFPPGEAFLITREAFEKIGGFDEDFFLYMEDGDLGWRLRLAGYRILLSPSPKITHFRSMTTRRTIDSKRVFRLCERNRLISCFKNLERSSFTALAIYEIRRLISLLRAKEYLLAYVEALLNILTKTDFGRLLLKRHQVQSTRLVTDKKLFERSIRGLDKNTSRLGRALYRCFA